MSSGDEMQSMLYDEDEDGELEELQSDLLMEDFGSTTLMKQVKSDVVISNSAHKSDDVESTTAFNRMSPSSAEEYKTQKDFK